MAGCIAASALQRPVSTTPTAFLCRGPGGFEGPRRGAYPDGPGPIRFGGPPEMPFGPRFDGPPGWHGSSGGFDGPPGPGRGFGGPPDWNRGRTGFAVGSARQFPGMGRSSMRLLNTTWRCYWLAWAPCVAYICTWCKTHMLFSAGRPPSPRFYNRYRSRSPEWGPQHGGRCGWIALMLLGSLHLQRNA